VSLACAEVRVAVGCVICTFGEGSQLVIEFSQLGCTSIVGRCRWLIWLALLGYLSSGKSLRLVSYQRPRSSSVRHHEILKSSSRGWKSSLLVIAFVPIWSVINRVLSKFGRIGCP